MEDNKNPKKNNEQAAKKDAASISAIHSAQDELRKINDVSSFDDNSDNINDEIKNEKTYAIENEIKTKDEIAEDEDEYNFNDTKDIKVSEIKGSGLFGRKSNNSASLQKRKIKYLPVHILAFAVPFVLMLIAYSTIKIFPFGDRQIMVVDSWHQYYPFLQELQYKLTHGQSLLYSWNTGGGTNFLALMSYYASTPLYLLSVLFPEKYLREFMMLATVTKIACSGLFFSVYLRGMHNHDFRKKTEAEDDKKYCSLNNGFIILGFSVLYAVSAYAVGYYWCIMWLDCMALLPLIILGLERLIDSGKYKLYMISLGVTIVCNYYIGIFVCMFIAVYYIVLYFTKIKKPSVQGFITKTAKVVGASIVGVGLSMFILLPTFLWFGNTGNANSTFARDIATYNSILDIVTNLLPNTTPATRAGLPNIACGLIVVVMAGLYFLNSKIRTREKFFMGGFLIFMLFSFNVNILDFYWHGMHFPNEIPYRQAFVFTFVIITMAYKSYTTLDGENVSKNALFKFCMCIFGYLLLAEQWYKASDKKDVFNFKVFYVAIIILIVYMVVLMLYKNSKMSKTYLAVILMFAMIFEGGMSAIKGAATTGTSDRNGYVPSKENIQRLVKDIYEKDDEKFFRLEMSRWYTTNDPAVYRYRGISQFSSEANSKFARTLEVLGIAATITSNRYLYSSATPVFNSIMSIKYLMTREDDTNYNLDSVVFEELSDMRKSTIDEEDESETQIVNIYENKYWLPLGFAVSEDIKEINVNEQNIFITQNDLIKKAAGITEDVFKSIEQSGVNNDNLTESRSKYGVYTYSMTDKSRKGTVNHVYTSDIAQQVYIYLKSTRTPSSMKASVSVNGASKSYEVNRGITIDCGYVQADQDINVSFDIEASESGSFNIFVAGFSEAVFKNGYDILNSSPFIIEKFKDTDIKGTIEVDSDGLFFTSIPYDKGWNLKIDGKKVEINPLSEAEINDVNNNAKKADDTKKVDERQIKKITDGFITAPISAGTHTIELYYITDGLIPGILITLLSAGIIVGLEFLLKNNKKQKKSN